MEVQSRVKRVSLTDKASAVVHLSRWREHVPYTIPLVVCGAMLAVHLDGFVLGWNLLAVVAANILAMAFAFMINDVEDAPDDAREPRKRARNPIANGTLTQSEGYFITAIIFAISLMLYVFGGWWSFGLGGITLVLSYLYSAHPFRLKARPITDVTSHALMLSGLLVMSGFFTYSKTPGIAWLVIAAATLFSAYGQFYNQLDDYEVDKAAGLQNTVVLLGKPMTILLMYASILGAGICMMLAIWNGAFPLWLASVAGISIFVASIFTWDRDMRGNPAEGTAALQKPALLVANMITLIWMAHELGLLATVI